MNSHEELELKKEFQLERIILFSDAVFAIIITIMVIELKFPDSIREATAGEFKHEALKVYIRFVGYVISFFFVAMFWSRHVKLFGYLKDYNKQLLVFNLIFLFCISLFPFAATMITGFKHINSPQATWGFFVYLMIIMCCVFSYTLLCSYMIRNKEKLCFGTDIIETDLKWKAEKANYVFIPLIVFVIIAMRIYDVQPQYYTYVMAGYGIIISLLTKRYYPKTSITDKRPALFRIFNRRQKKIPKAKLPSGD